MALKETLKGLRKGETSPQLPPAPDDYPSFPDTSAWPVVFPELPRGTNGRFSRPPQHTSGQAAPRIPVDQLPNHIAVVMDGNGRWAKQRGLARTEGHKMGEAVLIDITCGAIELGVKHLSVYAFSTENWKRSAEEVRFLMGFNREVVRRRREALDLMGVNMRWVGSLVAEGKLSPDRITEATLARHMHRDDIPDVDLFIRTSGEQRASNFMLWQSAYAEYVFQDKLWPDYDRRDLWAACEEYVSRNRRFGRA